MPLKPTAALLLLTLSPLSHAAIEWQAPLLQNHPLVGKIYDLKTEQPLSEAQLIERLRQAPLVLIGEKHDNRDHHQLEARLIRALTDNRAGQAVVFEMLDASQQPVLDQLAADASLEDMKQQLDWRPKSWSWSDYGPLFHLTRQQQATLVAGNISRTELQAIYKQQHNALADPRFTTVPAISQAVRDEIQDALYRNHCELMPREQLAPMVNIQLARDASMAKAMLTQPGPAVLITGGFHARKNLSVPLHLALHDQQRGQPDNQAVVMLAEVDLDKPAPTDYSSHEQADYLWLTPKQNNRDYCAEMKASMQQKHNSED